MDVIQLEWYQQGFWPLVGAALILIIPNAVALWGIFIQTNRQTKSQIKLKKLHFINEQLVEFYDPLFTLLSVNGDLFLDFGPHSFKGNQIEREAAGVIWNKIKEEFILLNNKEIINILRTKSHLIDSQDSINHYLILFKHLSMYDIFTQIPNEIYGKYKFPTGIVDHVISQRNKLLLIRQEIMEGKL